MSETTEWSIEFYIEEGGDVPVAAFFDQLDIKTRARFRASLERLRQENVLARFPLVAHLEGDLWEWRESSNANIYRVVYFVFTGRRIVLLHGFQKKTQRTPPRELDTARRRHRDFLERQRKSKR